MKEVALHYVQLGLSVMPSEGKRPAPSAGKWKPFQEKRPTPEQVDHMFGGDVTGIAVIGGTASEGLEIIDVDSKNDPSGKLNKLFLEQLEKDLPYFGGKEFPITQTPSGGLHVYYRAPNIEGNQDLAVTKDNKVLIETRGSGGYVVAPPSEGYTLLSGSIEAIPTLTEQQRDALIGMAKIFNQKDPIKIRQLAPPNNNGSLTPWEEYDADTSDPWMRVLQDHGWTIHHEDGARIHFKRPGSENPYGANWHREHRKLFVHTPSSEFKVNEPYSPSAIYAILEHHGDFSASAKALRKLGYGKKNTNGTHSQPSGKEEEPKELHDGFIMDLDFEPKFKTPIVTLHGHRVLRSGNVSMIVAGAGAGKSQLCSIMAASFLAKSLNIQIDDLGIGIELEENKEVLYIDTERELNDVYFSMKGIHRRLGKPDSIIEMRDEKRQFKRLTIESAIMIPSIAEKEALLDRRINEFGDRLGLLILDGVGDFVTDVNDSESVQNFTQKLIGYANTFHFGVLLTLHSNPKESKPRGHLGSELWRKCDSCFILKRADDNRNVRWLTTEFEFGKNRSDTDNLGTYFTWSAEHRYFVHVPGYNEPNPQGGRPRSDYSELFKKVFEVHGPLKRSALKDAIMKIHTVSKSRAYEYIDEGVSRKIIVKKGTFLELADELPF